MDVWYLLAEYQGISRTAAYWTLCGDYRLLLFFSCVWTSGGL